MSDIPDYVDCICERCDLYFATLYDLAVHRELHVEEDKEEAKKTAAEMLERLKLENWEKDRILRQPAVASYTPPPPSRQEIRHITRNSVAVLDAAVQEALDDVRRQDEL